MRMLIAQIKHFLGHNILKSMFFCIGLFLTILRSYECFQKYLYNNLSTKVTMEDNFQTLLPSLVVCDYKDGHYGYNER